MSVNSLGPFTFIRMDANGIPNSPPPIVQTDTSIVLRPGVPGVGIIDMARRGRPFPLMTRIDVASHAAGEALRKTYSDAIAGDALDLVLAGVNYSEIQQTQYVILSVNETQIIPHFNAIGGLNGGRFLLLATFVLLPVAA